MRASELIFLLNFKVLNGTQEIGLSYLKNSFSASDNLTFAITGGADQNLFTIDATTGVLTFNEQAFVDTALDFDRDGIYDLQITVSGSDPGDTQTANLGVEVAYDSTLSQVSDLTLAQEVNESGATVITLTGKATDDGSGMIDGSMALYIKHALTGKTIYLTSNLSTISLDAEGNFSLSTTLDASHPDGLWYISYIQVEDMAGNRFYKEVYQSGNAEATLEVANGLYLGASDKILPQVSDLTLAQEVNESGATVITLTGKATDDGSGMIDGSMALYIKHALTGKTIYLTSNLSTISLDAEGNFSLSTTLDASHPDGLWYISYIQVEDMAGNRFYKEVYQSGNAEATLEVANGLYLGASDKILPQVSDLTLAQEVNESGATVITLTGKATDDGSGMIDGSMALYIKHALTGKTIYLTSNLSTISLDAEGNFSLSTTLDASHPDGLWYISYIQVEDMAGNRFYKEVYQSGNAEATLEVANGLYLGGGGGSPGTDVDNTAPEFSDMQITTYTEDGYVWIKISGTVTDNNFNYASLWLGVAGNPESSEVTFSIYNDQNYTGNDFAYTHNPSTGAFTTSQRLDDTHISGTYYLDRYTNVDQAQNRIWEYIQSGGTDTPLLGLSINIDNPIAVIDNTAPEFSDMQITTYTEDGYVWIKISGTVTDNNFNYASLWLGVAGNPEASEVTFSIYNDQNYTGNDFAYTHNPSTGAFTTSQRLDDTHISGTYYLDRYTNVDQAQNRIWEYIQSGGTDTPLLGLSINIDNPIAVIDNTAPEFSDMQITTYTEDGYVWIKISGTVTDNNFNYASLWLGVAGNPEASEVTFSIYNDQNYTGNDFAYTHNPSTGAFTTSQRLDDTHISGTYYLDRYTNVDQAQNRIWEYIQSGGTDTPLLGLSVDISKDAPISIEITRNNATEINEIEVINEGQFGASLGKITVNGNDALGLFDLAISGVDAALLEISPLGYLRLKSSVNLDFDDQPNLSFTITATNTLGESFDRSYSLSIQDLQLAPTAVLLDGVNKTTVQVEENQTGALVGNLSSADGDDADTHTYALSQDSEIFEISNNTLKFKDGVSLNFEDQNSYTVTVTSTDSTGLSYSEIFTIQVTDINEAPTDITLASLNIPERLDGAEIGLITVSDVDANESFAISVNDDRFEVVNNVLKLKDSVQLQFSQVSQVTLIVTVTDSGGNSLQESFTLLVGSIQLDVYAVDENVAGASVGALSVSDTSVTGDISYVLSGSDADQFEVVDGVLKLKSTASADFETKSSYTLTITATGANNVAVEASLIVNVSDLNDAPTAVTISGDLSINENQAGASIGTLGTTDEDAGDSFVYSVSGTDADSFEIVNGILKLKAGLSANYEIQSSYSVTITSTDSGGLQTSNNFEVQVSDLAESPTAIIVSKDAPAPPPTGEGETIQIVVTVQNNQFYFNGELQSEFKLVHGNTYVFQQNAGENGHVLGISAVDGGASVAGITYSYQTSPTGAISSTLFSTYDLYLTNPAYASALSNWNFFLTYTVPADGPDTLYFFSSSSAVTGGVFNVGSAYVAPVPVDPKAITVDENELGAVVGKLSVADEDAGDTHTYTLSGADADLFEIVDGQLKLVSNAVANYELKNSYAIIITATDSSGLVFSNALTVFVNDVNESPTGVLISSLRVEDATDGIIVGILSTVDQDTNDTYTYTLSGDDADKFEVVDGQLKLKDGVAADYETQSTYSVTVTSTDSGGETAAQTFTLNVVTTINLTSYSFAENTAGVLIGDLSVTDETFSSNVTYALSGADGDQFEIVNNQLKLKDDVSANFEVKDAYAIVITVTDDAGLEAIINFSLSVTDQPDAPTAISLSQAEPEPPAPPPTGEGETIQIVVTVQNNQFYFNGELQSEFKLVHGNTYVFQQNAGENGHVLGISAVDGGASVAGITYSYQTSPTGAISSTLFSTYDLYLTNPAYASALSNWNFFLTYTVPADGPDTLYFFSSSSAVTGGVFNVGSAYVAPPPSPTPVDPDAIVINENELGAVVGTLLTTDEDAGDTHTYTLSGADADLFEIVDGKLKLKGSISVNYENTPLLNVTLTSTDSTNQSVSQDFVIKVADQNDSPTGVLISSLRVEDATDGIIVGILSTVDQDTNDTYTYTLSGDDADKFEVVDGQLKLKDGVAADYETQSTYSVTVTSTDSGGETAAQTFTLNVVTTINLTSYSFAENTAGVLIGDLSVTDETFSSNVTYALSGADGDQFEIVNNQLKLKDDVSANFEVKDAYAIVITVTDDAGLEAIINFSLSVTDQPDAPTAISLSQAEPEPPAPPPTGEGETIQIVVTVQNNQFYFNGELQSEFKLVHGNTYVFQQNAGENGHVLGISAVDGGASVAGITYSYQTSPTGAISSTLFSTYDLYLTNPAYASALSNWNFFLTYTVPADGPDTLYFFSSSSAVTGGVFNVGSAYVAPPPSPTPVDPDAIVINENELGAVVGTLLTTDEDAGDTHTYTLSGADADLFEIVDGKLKLKDSISSNYEVKNLLNISITATDSTGLSFTQSIKVTVNNVNEQPTQIKLSKTSFDEAIGGAVVGTLSTVDEDIGDTYTYTLSGDDADKFEVVDGELKLKNSITADYETLTTYSVTVTSTDSGGLSLSQDFALTVNNVNEPVTSITLGASNFAIVSEGIQGQIIGEFLINDPDLNEIHTYLLTGKDAKYFEVVDGVLKLKADVTLDYETLFINAIDADGNLVKKLDISVTVIDSGGYAVKNNFNVYVSDANDAPTEIILHGAMLESAGTNKGNVIGKFAVTDVDDQSFTFMIESVTSSNGKTYSVNDFNIVNGFLVVTEEDADGNWTEVRGDFGDVITFTISATDSAGNKLSQQFDIGFGSLSLVNFNYSPDPSNMGYTIEIDENVANPFVGEITGINGSVFDEWTYTLSGPDAKYFEIRGEANNSGSWPAVHFIGTPDHETKAFYDLVVVATRSDGTTIEDYWTIEVIDRNDQPNLWYSHANNSVYLALDWHANVRMFGITEDTTNAYIMTLAYRDQDPSDTYSIQISYQKYSGFAYDENGDWVATYNGDVIDITNLFTFDQETGALYFSGSQLDYESTFGDDSGINSSHQWHEPITITVTDSQGAKSIMTVLMEVWDSAADGQFNIRHDGSYTNFNNEQSYPLLIGGYGDSDTGKWPSFKTLSAGDINGDGIPDLVGLMVNLDYGYLYGESSSYSYIKIALGGPNSFPNYQPGTGTANHNDVLGSGPGAVYVRLPTDFTTQWGDIRNYPFQALGTGDYNGDGKDDLIFQLYSPYTGKDYLVIGYGQDFDNSSVNVMDLSNIFYDDSNGKVIDLSGLSDNNLYLKAIGDLNNDGKDDFVFSDERENVYIVPGQSPGQSLAVIHLDGNLLQADSWFGDSIAIGDFNGDGRDDLAITADKYDQDVINDSDEGAIYIYLSGFNGIGSTPDITIIGDSESTEIGWGGIVNLGDINGDGYDDLGFADDDGYSWIFWGSAGFSGTLDLDNTSLSSTEISVFDIPNIHFNEVIAIGDINGDGYDDLAAEGYETLYVLYGMQAWNTLYESTAGLNILEITGTHYSSDVYALGDIDGDGKDEFAFTGTSSLGYSVDNFLTIWQGDNPNLNANGFAIQIDTNSFAVDENKAGVSLGSITSSSTANLEQYDFYITSVRGDGTTVDNIWFDISTNGEITLKPGVSLNTEEYGKFQLRIFIVDSANSQISQHYIDIMVNDVNEAPSLSLSSRFVDDTASAGTVIGVLSANDPDNNAVTLSLSGADASKFVIDAETNELKFADGISIDVNSQVSFSITVTATDTAGIAVINNFTVEVNQAPTDLIYEAGIVQESARGIALGQIKVTDPNSTDSFSYTLEGDYASIFEVSDQGVLMLAGNFFLDFEILGETMALSVTATDISGLSITKDIVIQVADLKYATPDAPELVSNYVITPTGTIIDALFLGKTLDPDWDPNTPLVVSYSFTPVGVTSLDPDIAGQISNTALDPETLNFRQAVIDAFNYLGTMLGITFIEVIESDIVVGDIRLVLYDNPNEDSQGTSWNWNYIGSQYWEGSGDLDIQVNLGGLDTFEKGSYGYMTILHEIGHSIGLDHPFTPETGGWFSTDYRFSSIDELGYTEFGWLGWTLMDYRHYIGDNSMIPADHPSATAIVISETGKPFYPTTFMPLDISASLYLYGWWDAEGVFVLNPVNSGDNTYVLEGPFFETIHDTGGTDTLDWSAMTDNTVVNLNPFSVANPDSDIGLSYFGENKLTITQRGTGDVLKETGWILGISEFTVIENVKAGSGNDSITLNDAANLIQAGAGNDSIFNIGFGDNVYGDAGNDKFYALSDTFSIIDGGEGSDTLHINQTLLDSGLYSVDFRDLTEGQIQGIEALDYSSSHVSGPGQILISANTFKSLDKTTLTITATWNDGFEQAVGLEGNFILSGSTDSYDRYLLNDDGVTYTLWVWKDHYVYQIEDSSLSLSLSNEILVDDASWHVGMISISGDNWLNPDHYWREGNAPDGIFTISGDDASYFSIYGNQLYINWESKPDFETKASYSITITVVSLSGQTVSKDFTLQVQDTDESLSSPEITLYEGGSDDDYIVGGSGFSDLRGAAGNDVIYGGSGDDELWGDSRRGYTDPVQPGDGDDTLYGGFGDDRLWGNGGNDALYGDWGSDTLYGQQGNDTLYGGSGDDDMRGGTGDDVMHGGADNDSMFGDEHPDEGVIEGNGDDIMYGDSGNDTMQGGAGNDILYGGADEDLLGGNSGNDTLYGNFGNDTLVGHEGDDTLYGGSGNDLMYGDGDTGSSSSDGADVLWGGTGNDEIYGRGGDDYLIGQSGLDVLTGGEGADTFVLTGYGSGLKIMNRNLFINLVDGFDCGDLIQ